MWHIGIDLHRHTITVAAVNDSGEVRPAKRFICATSSEILSYFEH
jgi:predicted NBD/HSP70 family sugar kinase